MARIVALLTALVCSIWVIPFVIVLGLISLWTQHELTVWVSYFSGHVFHASFLVSLVLTVVGNIVIPCGMLIVDFLLTIASWFI